MRSNNQDALLLEPDLGLFGVFDGMGGAQAGEVAAQTARDAVRGFLRGRGAGPPGERLTGALVAACAEIHAAATRDRALRGMGTTAVLVQLVGDAHAVVAHVGDSRAFLWREGRLLPLTVDHTVVTELVARGALSPEEAEDHPHRSVLSRNLGALPTCKVDVLEVPLTAGDRLLVCSDGLHGYAHLEAISQLLGAGDDPAATSRELIELALRGGGGDNVTAVVIDAAGAAPSATQVLRTAGASAWAEALPVLRAEVIREGLARSPVLASLGEAGALELLAEDLGQAVRHDLERSSAVNAWTLAYGVASAWLGAAPGDATRWPALRGLLDGLSRCAHATVAEVARRQPRLEHLMGAAVGRVLNVAELAVATVLAEQVRAVEGELAEAGARAGSRGETAPGFNEQLTVPFVRPSRVGTTDGAGPALTGAVRGAVRLADAHLARDDEPARAALAAIEAAAVADEPAGAAATAAHELFGVRTVDPEGMRPLFDALARARAALVGAVSDLGAGTTVRAATTRRLGLAQQRIGAALAALAVEASEPARLRLREARDTCQALREQLAAGDRRRAKLEAAGATVVDQAPVGAR